MTIHQLNKLNEDNSDRIDFYPLTVIQAIFDKRDGTRLDSILDRHNSIVLQYVGTKEDTRLTVPKEFRKQGLIITYVDSLNNITIEVYNNTSVEDTDWKNSSNWINYFSNVDLSNYVTVTQLTSALQNKQDTLVSGINVKTVNNQSILGEGNIDIENELPSDGKVGQVLTKTSTGVAWGDIESGDNYPSGGTTGQVLKKTSTGVEWGDDEKGFELPTGGTDGQVLKKRGETVIWQDDKDTTYNKATQSTDGLMSKEDKSKLDNIISIPDGGSSGQVLKKTETGVEWGTDDNTTYQEATQQSSGLLSKEDKVKLDSIQSGANKYTLPIASNDTLGGVKIGAGLSINQGTGVLSATGGGVADSVDWNNITSKPSTFTPSEHTHTTSDITDFPTFKTVNGESITGEGDIEISLNTPTAEATSVDSTSDPVVNITDQDGTWNFSFQIPRGQQGPQGEQGEQGPAGEDGQDGSDAVSYVILPNTNVIKNQYIKNITVTTNIIRYGVVGPDTHGLYIEYSTEGEENKSITIEDRKNNVTEVSFAESDVTKVTIYLTLSSTGVSSSSERLACATVTSVFDGKNAEPSENNFICKIIPTETIIYGQESTTVILDTQKMYSNTTQSFLGALRITYKDINGSKTEESITGRTNNVQVITIPSNIRAVTCYLYYEDRTESANIADVVFIYRVNPLNCLNATIITQSEYNQLQNKDSNTIYFIKG